MAPLKACPSQPASRAHVFCIIILQFLVQFSQGQGPGDYQYQIREELPPDTLVGRIHISNGYTYRLGEQSPYVTLERTTGNIKTKLKINREDLPRDSRDEINLFVIADHPDHPSKPLEVSVEVLDINDNAPVFQEKIFKMSIPENSPTTFQQFIITANDPDKGENGSISNYAIVSGNEDNKFKLIEPSSITPLMYLGVQGNLDRENKDFYQLNISATDNGNPSLKGYLQVDITITDTNDNSPTFNPSEFETKINESSPVDTSVATVHATDADKGLNSEIAYRINDINNEQFKIEEGTGVIRTLKTPLYCHRVCARSLRSCNPNSCLITVEASDRGSPSLIGRAYITIIINDENDHDPVISFTHFPDRNKDFSTVDENVRPGIQVASILVRDKDSGENGQTSASIIGGNELGHFRITTLPVPGASSLNLVQVVGNLDRERVSLYNLTVRAVDHGYPQRSATSHLIIYVSDANDHAPAFEKQQYWVKMSELELPGSRVESVTATDEDSGDNSALSYSIITGNELNWFRIDPATGLVTTQAKLDHETTSLVVMNISAEDAGALSFRNFTTLTVEIVDENDWIPTFKKVEQTISIPEDFRVGNDILSLTAEDHDEGMNGTVRYEFHPSVVRSYPNTFYINKISGRLQTETSLDRESVSQYIVKVIAKDGGMPPLSSTATVTINIDDMNDNAPTFSPQQYFASVLENQPAGSNVLQVTAYDLDDGANARITYSFYGGSYNSFSISSSTGWIRTTTKLDKTQQQPYILTVRAKDDGGKVAPADARVEVTVAALNDVAPIFQAQSYVFSVDEDGDNQIPGIGKSVGRVAATSPDGLSPTYAIIGGDPFGVFSIDRKAGLITTVKNVDREVQAEYDLHVIARGQSKYRDMLVKVQVTDINDNSPVFVDKNLEISIPENWPVGRNIYYAEARDTDHGPNAKLSYSLTSNSNGVFMIKPETGVVYLNKLLDQLPRTSKTHLLSITATDAGTPQLSTSANVTVHIIDVNNHNPVFPRGHYEMSINETKPVNEPIVQLIATDDDSGRNGELVYKITRGNMEGKFGIFPDGTLFVAHALDREQRDIYYLSVTVHDRGVQSRRSTANITFHILDDNDNKPVFTNSTYDFYVRENMPVETFIGAVRARDADIGRNAEIIYSTSEDQLNFAISAQTGEIVSMKSFDRESLLSSLGRDYYAFEITATDNGLERLHENALVKVHVTDDNDNPPVFSRQIYSGSVMENAKSGKKITTVTANDVDVGENGAISYSFLSGNEEKNFKIDETSGQVTLIGSLDRETKDHFRLVILATDSVDVDERLSATATLYISVLDFNDNKPVFSSPPTETDLLESAQPGELVAVFSAEDQDISNNAILFFEITQGNSGAPFNLDTHTGKLYLNKPLDHETTKQYILTITVSDAGQPKLSSTTIFKVNVLDVNDNAPVFSDGGIIATMAENTPPNKRVAAAKATDDDSGSNGDISYMILQQEPPGQNFRINPQNGDISVREMVDHERSPVYILTVMATDQATNPQLRLSATKKVNLRLVDVNDNSPTFVSPNTFVVSASATRSVIAQVKADDPDARDNGRVSYSLQSGDRTLFEVSSTGQLSLNKNFPGSPQKYSITIKATDHGDNDVLNVKSTSMNFTILIKSDVSGPRFARSEYTGSVYENRPTGTSVFEVEATPTRAGVSVEYFITEISGSKGRLFDIDKTSGEVTTTQRLDRESLPGVVDVEIYAAEIGGNGPRTQSVKARISILDENDTPPEFERTLYARSVPENVGTGHTVLHVDVSDEDTIGNIELQLNGDGASDFSITNKGILTTNKVLSRSRRRAYVFRVQASDGSQTSTADIQITVDDENDHEPAFSTPFYSFDVQEDTAIGTTVASVTAIDDDDTENGQVTYDLISDWGKDKFQLDSTLGTLTLVDQLDFEEVQVYTLKVLAKDGGSSPRSSTATVIMNVKDMNDNTPVFDPMSYSREVREDVPEGTSLLNVSATDIDFGVNSRIRYSLGGGDKKNQFGIGPSNGTIYTIGKLDRETIPRYNLIVIATDQAEPPSDRLSTSATVNIQLKDVNDCQPEFVSSNVTWVKEDSKRGSVVFTVVARDLDAGESGNVSYSVSSSSRGRPFTINPASGDLIVNTDLDRESVPNFTMTVTANDLGQPSLSSSQNLLVHIKDVNDNAPQFVKSVYGTTVAEDVAVGKSLLKVSAHDMDSDLNGIVRYYITGGDRNYDFNLDMSSGVLRVQKNLDYERDSQYTLIVQAEDSGIHTVLSATATVVVNVTDVNDNTPVFVDSPYVAYVQENTEALPVHVMQVTASDKDSAPNSQLTYSLLEDQGIFDINSQTGKITLRKTLDRETIPEYQLIVVARDSGLPRLTGTGTVRVLVQDVNDHAPIFDNTQYTGHVNERAGRDTAVLTVTATDQDEGDNAEILYSLKNSMGGKFTIYPSTGQIVTLEMLDREERDEYKLVVIATDRGIPPQSVSSAVTIYIDDDNDNSPEFEQHRYAQTIYDPTAVGVFVLGVTAVDRDIGSNGKVVYSISGTDASKFTINQATGVITAAQILTAQRYTFKVRATDQGMNPRSNTVDVEIDTRTTTDSRPVFRPFSDNLSIKENSPVGKILTTVQADLSNARSSQIVYYISGGNINRGFGINRLNGTITVSSIIDYETTPNFELWIEASGGHPPLSAFKKLQVTVEDDNDNTPRFEHSSYNTSINENVGKGTPVKKLSSTDLDSNKNGQLSYSIEGGNTNNTFRIDTSSGLISTNNNIDRESTDLYHLMVKAKDQGSPQRTATTTVTVHVVDLNDNPPKFTRLYSLSVPENMQPGTFIVQLTTVDRDIGDNARSNFQLLGWKDVFSIDSLSGNISLAAVLDAESELRYSVRVKATDGSYRVETEVRISVKDVNDNAPVFVEDTLSFNFQERQKPNTVIGSLSATDNDVEDPNNKFIFSLKHPSDIFEINAETGEIKALKTLYYHSVPDHPLSVNRYSLDVVVTDLGTPSLSSENLVIITVTDANNHPPKFVESSYFSAVPYNTGIGEHVITVLAVDEDDVGINAEVLYSIISGNGSQFMQIHSETGSISVKSSLQGQQRADLVLTVKAEDKGSPALSSTITVQFKVTDVNRFNPRFTSNVFRKSLAEDADVNEKIEQFSAQDSDSGVNGQVIFLIMSGNEDGFFKLGKETGLLTVAKKLDYDTQKTHVMNITARDRGLFFKQTTRTFTLDLVDINDNPPVFNQTVYDAYIPENSPPFTPFFTLQATDADSGPNAVIHYDLVGNEGSAQFTVGKDTGIIRSKVQLDFETRESYIISVMAYNPSEPNGGRSMMKTVVTVNIHIVGVNEFFPQFAKKEYNYRVSESAPINSPIGSVFASDQDKGLDGIVYYFLLGSSNLKGFKIGHETGVIHVAGRPDYESSPDVLLTVMAKNWGSVRGNDTDICQVNITIEDANDPPVFDQDEYLAKIDENSGAETRVIKVSATDNDIKPENRNFVYTILRGNDGNRFKIDRTSGQIRVTGQGILDRETEPVYNVTVGAVDSGVPPQTGSVLVKVQLNDLNDNAPYFDPTVPVGKVMEEQSQIQVAASLTTYTRDQDEQPNTSPYRYRLLSHTDFFEILPHNGRVQTLRSIDRESQPEFILQVQVSDNGSPTMSSTLSFKVEVQDINDNKPEERALTLDLMILQGMSSIGKVADVRPLDRDTTGNYSCSITSGDTSTFSIYQNCDLRVVNSLAADAYQLRLTGSDGVASHPAVTYDATVNIRRYQNTTVDNSVPVLINSLSSKSFLEFKYQKFLNAVNGLFSAQDSVQIYNLKPMDSDLIVFLSVQKQNGDYITKTSLQETLNSNKVNLESSVGVTITSVSYDTCSDHKCENSGFCETDIIMHQGFSIHDSPRFILTAATPEVRSFCVCPPSYTGQYCEIPMAPCGDHYCYNGGSCVEEVCQCTPQWQGPNCKTDVNECVMTPGLCKNGGACVNLNGTFRCDCRDEYHGERCENTLYCTSSPCHNGAECVDIQGGFTCKCLYGFFGTLCESSSKGFSEGSFLEFPPLSNLNNTDISLFFATNKLDALLFLGEAMVDTVTPGFLALEIVDGKLRFSVKFRSKYPKILLVDRFVADGNWYRVKTQKVTQGAILEVSSCPSGDTPSCVDCKIGDPSCYAYRGNLSSSVIHRVTRVSIGGVKDVGSVLQFRGDIETHDFVGCIHSYEVNGVDVVDVEKAVNSYGISDKCPRSAPAGQCGSLCRNSGVCMDEWNTTWCQCTEQFMGQNCEEKWQPFGFGPNVVVEYKVRESYRRDTKMAELKNRRKRSTQTSTVFVRFRTTRSQGNLLYMAAATNKAYLWIEENLVKFAVTGNENTEPVWANQKLVNDGAWHNVTVTASGNSFTIDLDGVKSTKEFEAPFIFSSVDITAMTVSGERQIPSGRTVPGFDGCISSFRIDGEKLVFGGSSSKYSIAATGNVEKSCKALCDNNPCDGGKTCSPDGEGVTCAAVGNEGTGLQIGIIIVICFFCILFVAIIVVFIIFKRRGTFKQSCLKSPGKSAGNLGNSLGGSQENPDSGYVENPNEEMIIGNHITNELMLQKHHSLSTKPDLIGSNVMGRALPQPVELEDGTVIVENGGGMAHMQPYDENMPECYDLENASSIAPSDIDVTLHYRQFRNGQGPRYKPPFHQKGMYGRHGESPLTFGANGRPGSVSPSMLKPHSNGFHNPSGSAVSVPARNSPHVINPVRRPNSAQAIMRASPHHRNSPLTQLQMRNTPLSQQHGSRSNSSHSLGSHHSHTSSSSSATRGPQSHFIKPNKPNKKHTERGLTVEEINRLNARSDKLAPVSVADLMSSSSGDRKYRSMKLEEQLDSGVLLEPPDSSSEDSGANDSFTCSEFEYDNDRTRNDFDQGLIFSKLPQVHESDENQPDNRGNSDGMDSNGDSFTSTVISSEDGAFNAAQKTNGTFNFDALMQWSPNFDKLVGVFHDIALLPDNEKQALEGPHGNDYEEYV